jgi:hypothetical protein
VNFKTEWPHGHPKDLQYFLKMFFCRHKWRERIGTNFRDVICDKCGAWSHWLELNKPTNWNNDSGGEG